MTKKEENADASRPKHIWKQEEVYQVMAWIDYCLIHRIDFYSTITDHLREVSGHELSVKQVDGKLRREWRLHGSDDCHSIEDLLKRGTREGMGNYGIKDHNGISDAFAALGPPRSRPLLVSESNSDSELSPPPPSPEPPAAFRPRRSTRKKPEKKSGRKKDPVIDLYAVPDTPEPEVRTVKKQNVPASTRQNRDPEVARSRRLKKTRSRKAAKAALAQSSAAVPFRLRRRKIAAEDEPVTIPSVQDTEHSLSRAVKSKTRSARLTRSRTPKSLAESKSGDNQPENSALPEDKPLHPHPTQQSDNDDIKRRLIQSNTEVLRCQRRIFALHNQFAAVREECETLKRNSRAAEANADNIGIQTRLWNEHVSMRRQIVEIQQQNQDLGDINSDCLGPPPSEVVKELRAVQGEILDACPSFASSDFSLQSLEGKTQYSTLLERWCRRVTGTSNIAEFLQSCPETSPSERDLLRSFVAAALCDFVFETGRIEDLGADSTLLSEYRSHVSTRYGAEALRQLDLLAYKSTTSKEYFAKSIISERATDVSELIVGTLRSPSIAGPAPGSQEETELLAGCIEGDGFQDISPTEALQHPVRHAIKLSTQLFLSQKHYKLVFLQPGAGFSPETMGKEGSLREADAHIRGKRARLLADDSIDPDHGKPIRLCLFPALYVRALRDERLNGSGFGKTLERSNFASYGEEESLDGFELLAKALVLV